VCLRAHGWTAAELDALAALPAAELVRRLAVIPSKLIEARVELRALQPIAGRFEFDGDSVCFRPRFPFVEGECYSLVADLGEQKGGAPHHGVWTIARPRSTATPSTVVEAICPSAATIPLNLLKVYVSFSAPMSEGWANRAVHVRLADDGARLADVFVATEPELWDPERRRLTLLLDPGRIKRGLVPHDEAGYPLIEGAPIIVSIDPAFRDAVGQPLRAGAERRYAVGAPVRSRVDPTDWHIARPAVGSRDPLTVEFDRPLDRALLEHCIEINDGAGVPINGRALVGAEEQCWRFEPDAPWAVGTYALVVDSRLEDLAGNSLQRVFDRDLMRPGDASITAQPAVVGFEFI
jgi:hypothetical protein